MPVDYIRYDILTQDALRGVVRTVMADAARNGLPGDHHFYITFDTQAPGVMISERLHAQYPQDMTIVLQHQFWDLALTEDGFEVGLAFNGIAERLAIPFAAIKAFVDPSVQFGLQFEVLPQEEAAPAETADTGSPALGVERGEMERKPRGSPRPQHRSVETSEPPTPANPSASTGSDDAPAPPSGGGEVVRLDRFRKK